MAEDNAWYHYQTPFVIGDAPTSSVDIELPADVTQRVCVLYEPRDGRIVHVYRVITLAGSGSITNEEIGTRAELHARQAGRKEDDLRALHVADYTDSAAYRVDVELETLIEISHPLRDGTGSGSGSSAGGSGSGSGSGSGTGSGTGSSGGPSSRVSVPTTTFRAL